MRGRNLTIPLGDVIHVSVLSSIYDLLVKKGAIYSDRPIVPMAGELCVVFPITSTSSSSSAEWDM